MAEMTDVLTIEPIMPGAEKLDFDRVVIKYDRDADILRIHFNGPRPAVMLDVDDHLLLGLDPVSYEVIGLQIEAYPLAALEAAVRDDRRLHRGAGDAAIHQPAQARTVARSHLTGANR